MQSESSSSQSNVATDLGNLISVSSIVKDLKGILASNLDPSTIFSILGGIDIKTMEIAKSFGVGKENSEGLKKSILASRDAVIQLGGDINTTFATQLAASQALGRNVALGVEAQTELYAASQVTNTSITDMVSKLKDVGISAYDAGDQMLKVVKSANEVGVGAQAVSKLVMSNVGQLNQFNFKDGIEGLSRMAAQATLMRFDMNETFKFANKVFNPEQAIQMAASLQRLGVTQSELLDPLNLMNLAENNPEELQNQLVQMSKQFVQMGEDGQFKIAPGAIRIMRELESKMGMADGTLMKLAKSSVEVEEKMKRIQFPSFVNEDQKKILANLSEMKGGQMMITVDGQTKPLVDALKDNSEEGQEGIKKLIESATPKTIEQVQESQLNVLQDIKRGINMMTGVIPTAIARTRGGEKMVRGIGEKISTEGENIFKKATGEEGTVGLSKKLDDAFNKILKETGKIDFKDMGKVISEINVNGKTLGDRFLDLNEKMKPYISFLETYATKKIGEENIDATKETVSKLLEKMDKFFTVTEMEDGIISPKLGTFKTLKEDDIYVGSGLSEMIDKLFEIKNITSAQPSNLVSNLSTVSPQEKVTSVESKSSPSEMKIDLNINVTAPPQIDTNQITTVLKDQFVIQQIIQKIEQVTSNNNLTKTPK